MMSCLHACLLSDMLARPAGALPPISSFCVTIILILTELTQLSWCWQPPSTLQYSPLALSPYLPCVNRFLIAMSWCRVSWWGGISWPRSLPYLTPRCLIIILSGNKSIKNPLILGHLTPFSQFALHPHCQYYFQANQLGIQQFSFHTDCVDSDINTTWWLSLQLLKYQEVITLLNKAKFFGITGRQNIVVTNNIVMIFVALNWYHWSLPKQYRQHQISHFSIEIYILFKCWQLGVSSKVVISSPNGRFRRCLDGMVGVRRQHRKRRFTTSIAAF